MHRRFVAKLFSFKQLASKLFHALVDFYYLSVLPRFTRLTLFLAEVTKLISLFLVTVSHHMCHLYGSLSTCIRWSIRKDPREKDLLLSAMLPTAPLAFSSLFGIGRCRKLWIEVMVLVFCELWRYNSIGNTIIREEHAVFQQIVAYRLLLKEKVNGQCPDFCYIIEHLVPCSILITWFSFLSLISPFHFSLA